MMPDKDTPRTNEKSLNGLLLSVDAEFAKRLERELTERVEQSAERFAHICKQTDEITDLKNKLAKAENTGWCKGMTGGARMSLRYSTKCAGAILAWRDEAFPGFNPENQKTPAEPSNVES